MEGTSASSISISISNSNSNSNADNKFKAMICSNIHLYGYLCSFLWYTDLNRLNKACLDLYTLTKSIPAIHCDRINSTNELLYYSNLRYIYILDASLISKIVMKSILTSSCLHTLQLQRLNISLIDDDMMTDDGDREYSIAAHRNRVSLRHLDLSYSKCCGNGLVRLCKYYSSQLKSLLLNDCLLLNDENISDILASMQVIETIHMNRVFNLKLIPELSDIKSDKLTYLSINQCSRIGKCNALHINSPLCNRTITYVDVSYTAITSFHLQLMITKCGNIRTIIAKQCLKLVDDLIVRSDLIEYIDIEMCCNIESICLTCCSLKSINLKQCYNLKCLSIVSNALTSLDLSMLPSLIYLDLKCNELCKLIIDGCKSLACKMNDRMISQKYNLLEVRSISLLCPRLSIEDVSMGGSGLLTQINDNHIDKDDIICYNRIPTGLLHSRSGSYNDVTSAALNYYDSAMMLRSNVTRSSSL